jgi:hypothetical protein
MFSKLKWKFLDGRIIDSIYTIGLALSVVLYNMITVGDKLTTPDKKVVKVAVTAVLDTQINCFLTPDTQINYLYIFPGKTMGKIRLK